MKVGFQMNCPKCGKPIAENLTKCGHCGVPLRQQLLVDDDYVFETELTQYEKKKRNIVPIVIAVTMLLCLSAVAVTLILYQRKAAGSGSPATTTAPVTTGAVTTEVPETSAPGTTAAQTTAPATTAPPTTAASTTAPQTTAAQTTVPLTDEEKLTAYARSSGMVDTLKAETDEHMTLSVTAENSMVIARYTIDLDSTDWGQQEYFSKMEEYFNAVSAKMDKMVYEMREKSGVINPVLQILAVDSNNVTVYNNIVD